MADEIERAARRAGTAVSWHGLEGVISPEDARDIQKFMSAAGIDWTANKQELVSVNRNGSDDPTMWSYEPVESHVAIRRSTDSTLLGVMGSDYNVHNPKDVLAPIHEAVLNDERFNWNFATSLRGGKIITACADFVPDYEVAGDKHEAFLFCTTSFDGTRATMMGGTTVRIVCANTLRMALDNKDTRKIVLKHRSSIEGKADKLILQINNVVAGFEAYKEIAETLDSHKIAKDAARDMLTKLLFEPKLQDVELENGKTGKAWSKPGTRTENRIEALLKSFDVSLDERGGESSLYTVLQGVTRFADHDRGVRMTEGRKERGESEEAVRFDSNLIGTSDNFKQEAFAMLLKQAPELLAA